MLTATDDQRRDKGTSYLMIAYIHSKATFSYIFILLLKATCLSLTSTECSLIYMLWKIKRN